MKKETNILSQKLLDSIEQNSGVLDNAVKEYTVYMHITPSGKRYIGLCSTDPEYRWGSNGGNYHGQVFGRAVKKYGWDNIEHIIVAENLLKEDAYKLEQELIAKYNTMNPKYGYNRNPGGNVVYLTPEQHQKRLDAVSLALKGRPLSEEHRKRIGDGNKGKVRSPEEVERIRQMHLGKPLSEEHKKKISEANKGRQPSHDEIVSLMLRSTGRTPSDETRERMSKAQKEYDNKRRKKEVEDYLAELAKRKAEKGKHISEGRRLAKEKRLAQQEGL